jgi:hypothetical protein
MNSENLVTILWLGVPIYLAVRLRLLGFTIGMFVLWTFFALFIEAEWLPCQPEWRPLHHAGIFISGFVLFSGFWFAFYGIRRAFLGKKPARRWARRLIISAVSAVALSFSLGLADFCLAAVGRSPIFSVNATKRIDMGGQTVYVGFGYVVVQQYKMGWEDESGMEIGPEKGPEIWYWFLPFTINDTTQKTGIRWIWCRGLE